MDVSHLALQQEVNQLELAVRTKKRALEALIQKVVVESACSSPGIHDSEAEGPPATPITVQVHEAND